MSARRPKRPFNLNTARGLQAELRAGAEPDRHVDVQALAREVWRVRVRDLAPGRTDRVLEIELARDELNEFLVEICRATWQPNLPARRVRTSTAAQILAARAQSQC